MNVIGLYPNLVPGDMRQKVAEQHPTKPPTLSGTDLEEGLKHLIKYLTHMRYQEIQKLQRQQKVEKGEESEDHRLDEVALKQLNSTLQLLDTTMLKCYIKVRGGWGCCRIAAMRGARKIWRAAWEGCGCFQGDGCGYCMEKGWLDWRHERSEVSPWERGGATAWEGLEGCMGGVGLFQGEGWGCCMVMMGGAVAWVV